MSQINESKLKRFLTRLFIKVEIGEPVTISFRGDKKYINQKTIESLKEKHR